MLLLLLAPPPPLRTARTNISLGKIRPGAQTPFNPPRRRRARLAAGGELQLLEGRRWRYECTHPA